MSRLVTRCGRAVRLYAVLRSRHLRTIQKRAVAAKGRGRIAAPNPTDENLSRSHEEYIPYLTALALLKNQLGANQEEISMWVFCGSKFGGIDGYHNPQLYGSDEPPPPFHFHHGAENNFDYLPQLMHCYFRRQDLETLNPANRYWTYTQLLESWKSRCTEGEAVALIAAKVATGELQSHHPFTGVTKGVLSQLSEDGFPPLEQGTFLVAEVKKLAAASFPALNSLSVGHSDLGDATGGHTITPVPSSHIISSFRVRSDPDANQKWWRERMRDAKRYGLAVCRASQGRGNTPSYWYPGLIATWLTDSRRGTTHMDPRKAAASLREHFPECTDIADRIHPPDSHST